MDISFSYIVFIFLFSDSGILILIFIILMPYYTTVKELQIFLSCGIKLHYSSVVASQESYLGTIENSKHN